MLQQYVALFFLDGTSNRPFSHGADPPSAGTRFQPDSSEKQNAQTRPPDLTAEPSMVDVDKNNQQLNSLAPSVSQPILLEEPSEVESAVPHPTESTPNLCIGDPTPPTPGPSITRNQHSNGMQSFPDDPSNRSYLHVVDPPSTFAQFQPDSSGNQSAHTESPSLAVEPSAVDVDKTDLKSLAFSGAKSILRGVRESADAFGPLKSIAGGLCFILENYEVRSSLGSAKYDAHRFLSERRQTNKR